MHVKMFRLIRNIRFFQKSTEPYNISFRKNILTNVVINMKQFYCTNAVAENEPFDITTVTKGDANLEHKYKVILLEAEVMRQDGKQVPSEDFLKAHHWEELLKMETRSARKKYLDFLFKVEKKKESQVYKKDQKRIYREENPQPEYKDDGTLRYDLHHNNILIRIYDTTINNMYNNKLIQAIQFGQKIVVDCGYDQDMITRENMNCAKQMMIMFAENRLHDDPYDVHFCNANLDSVLLKALHRHIPTMYEPSFPMNVHEVSYLDLFPKEQLVYLTPHCREELTKYSHDDIYIIGAIVDKTNNQPLSLAKAKREGLRMAKLPLDQYLQWGSGSGKSLTLNQMISILLDAKKTGDWNFALRHVPRRKLHDNNYGENIMKSNSLRYDRFNIKDESKPPRKLVDNKFGQNIMKSDSLRYDRYNDKNESKPRKTWKPTKSGEKNTTDISIDKIMFD